MNLEPHYLKKELYDQVQKDPSIFEFIQSGSLDGIWYWDLEDPKNEWMSPRFWTTLGYNPDKKKHLASEWQDLIHPDDLQIALENFEKHCADPNHPYDQVVRYRHHDGSTVWVRCRGIAIRDKAGKPIRILGAHTDLTPHKRAEEALRNSDRFLKAMFDSIQDGISVLDNDLNIVHVNKTMRKFYAHMLPLEGKKCYQAYRGRSKACLDCPTMRAFQTGELEQCEVPLIQEGRVTGVLELFAYPMLDESGTPTAVIEHVRDITERKMAEEALLESEEKLKARETFLSAIIENIPNMIFVKDAENLKFMRFNKAGEDLLGYSRKELIGKSDYDFFPKEEADFFTEKDREVLNEGILKDIPEELIQTKYKGERILHTKKLPLLDRNGRPEYLLGISEDITEKKQLQDQLQRSEKMKTLGTLAGGVAHDLNNILGGLVGYPELMLMDLPDDSPLREPILMIKNSGEKAAAIVQDLLTLARRGISETKITNLNDVISEYMKSPEYKGLKSFYPNVKIETNLEADLLNMSGSPIHLSKTVMNLISNAVEAVSGQGLIKIFTTNKYVDRPLKTYEKVKEGDYVVLTVADDGIGISPSDLERIFEPFYTKKVMGKSGTGLGMAVVWGTVKDHNGYIDAQSTEGKGTTIKLYFPATREDSKREEIVSLQLCMGKGERVLVVDDVEEQRQIATALLTKLGYSVDVVSSGEEAIEYMKKNTAALLILDMIMDPGMDGLDTYKKILELNPRQKAIIASGFSETDRVKEAQRLGAGQYVKKPYTLEKIGLAVKEELIRKASTFGG